MKKLVLLAFTLFTAYLAEAQSGLTIGLKAGGNYSSIVGDDVESADYRKGFHAGAYVDISLSDVISIRPEALYSAKGFKISETIHDIQEEGDRYDLFVKSRLHYIDVPVLAHFKAKKFFLEAGPSVNFLISADNKVKATYTDSFQFPETEEESSSSTEGYRKVNLGYALGLGYQLSNTLGIGFRYSGDISTMNEATSDEDEPANVKNSVFQLSFSVKL